MSKDFRIEYHGTITLVVPLTPTCRCWLKENVEDGALWFADKLAVEPRYLDTLVAELEDDGFTQEEE